MNKDLIYPRSFDKSIVYLKNVVNSPNIEVGDYTIYSDVDRDPRDFEKNNVLYQYPINKDKLIIGKFCSIASRPVWDRCQPQCKNRTKLQNIPPGDDWRRARRCACHRG